MAASNAARADVVWSGSGVNTNWTTPANWQGGAPPANDGTEQIVFGQAQQGTVLVNTAQSIRRMRFDLSSGGTPSYSLSGAGGATLAIGADGIEVSSSSGSAVVFNSSLGVVLSASQTWSVGTESSLQVSGVISGSGRLTLTGEGDVELSGSNTYTGGTLLTGGSLGIENNSALGTGSLTVSGPASIYSSSGIRTVANALNLNSSLLDLLPYGGDFRFIGPVTLGTNTTLRNSGLPVYFSGAMGETGGSRSLTASGPGGIVLSGANTYTGGSAAIGGALFFSNASAVPAIGALSSSSNGYIGIGFNTGVQSGFISKFSSLNTLGTIGFDTTPGLPSATIFNESINLSTLNTVVRLGSATRATLSSTAVITPAIAAGYRFGGGGGTLQVESKLTGANSLTVDSSSARGPLTLLVTNANNDYSGLTTVTKSALVFGAGADSSNSAAGSFILGSGGYIGTSDTTLTLATWLGKFSPVATDGVVGFDSANVSSPRTVSGLFDLTPFVTGTSIALGTSSAATVSGSISLPPLQSGYLFTGYKGGWLTVETILTGARSVQIGGASAKYPEFDPNDLTRMSTVFLNGSNSHSIGTTLLNGRLVVGQASALGSGSLTIDGTGAVAYPRLETSLTSNPSFANQLVVKDDFEIGGVNSFTWTGNVTNGVTTGTIRKYGVSNLTLSGNNTGFSGGFLINEGTLTFASDTAAGSGGLDLGISSGIAAFTTASPAINGLTSQSATARVTLAGGTLAINQASDATFRGQIQGKGGIAKTGAGTLRLETASSFTGGTAITAGTIDVASSGALGTNTVTLNGASSTLNVGPAATLANPLAFGGSGGRLSGHGAFSSSVVLGTNSVVAPGSSVGTLTFTNGLTLAPGGSYDFEVQDALGGPGIGWDFVQVSGPLTFTATSSSPFALNLISLNSSGTSGNAANFQSTNAYSWAIASATSFVNFDSNALSINTSNFTSALNGGAFTFTTSGNNLLLNFTPVPEPSTWALLLAGLGIVGLRKLRRRR